MKRRLAKEDYLGIDLDALLSSEWLGLGVNGWKDEGTVLDC